MWRVACGVWHVRRSLAWRGITLSTREAVGACGSSDGGARSCLSEV